MASSNLGKIELVQTNCTNVWRLRRKIFPKPTEQLTGKKDNKGDLVTNPDRLKEIYLLSSTYN